MSIEKNTVKEDFLNRLDLLIKISKTRKVNLAQEIGISPSAITEIVKGRSNPSPQTLKSLSRFFKVNEEWLEYGTGDKYTEYEPTVIHRGLTPDQEQILQALEGKPIAQQFIMDMMQLDEPDMLNAYSDFVRNWKGKN